MPAGRAHRDEATIDVVPEREPGAAAQRLQFPADVLSAPVEFEQLGGIGPLYPVSATIGVGAPTVESLRGADATEVAVSIERSPFAELLRVGQRLPDRGRGWRSSRTSTSVHFSPSF